MSILPRFASTGARSRSRSSHGFDLPAALLAFALAAPAIGSPARTPSLALRTQEAGAEPSSDAATPTPVPWDEWLQAAEAMGRPLVDEGLTPGFVLGLRRGDETRVLALGEVAPGSGRAPDEHTLYEIGSLSKVFTAILLADAVGRELVALDDPVAAHAGERFDLDDFDGEPVRLWHLATHTSGFPRMPGNFAPKNADDPYADYDEEQLFACLDGLHPSWAPGSRYLYSNLGFALLGELLAWRQDSSYAELLRTRLTEPLGLGETGVEVADEARARLAPGYDVDGRARASWSLRLFEGAGGIRSTMHDLLAFARACLHPEETPLAAALRLSMEIRHEDPSGVRMALGWHTGSGGATRWHNGQTGGYHTYFAIWPEGDVAVALLSNTTSGLMDRLADNVLVTMMGHEPRALEFERAAELTSEQLDAFAGTFTLGLLSELTIRREGDRLFARMSFQPEVRVYPSSPERLFYRAAEAALVFSRDDDGALNTLEIHQGGTVTRAVRKR